MKIIRLYHISTSPTGKLFILDENPQLQCFIQYAKHVPLKKLNMEQYFKSVNRDYRDYTKIAYGPVFGMDDPRNGYLFENNTNGELIVANEQDIITSTNQGNVLYADLVKSVQIDNDRIQNAIVTDYTVLDQISEVEQRILLDEWEPGISFLLVE
jgi:hypothetical protein